MARILCIDYGKKRTGIAVSDPLQIIATSLTSVSSPDLIEFLKSYMTSEEVELILIGYPLNLNNADTHATPLVKDMITKLEKVFPQIPLKTVDEQFTSALAREAMLQMGMKKKGRRQKSNVDEIAATMMLQEYMNSSR